jgi:hypothetical protein
MATTPTYFDSAAMYIDSATSVKEQIALIQQVRTALYNAAITGAASAHFTEFTMNDGQTTIRCNYRSVNEIMNSIASLRMIENDLRKDLNGRVVRLMDGSNWR